MKEDSNKKIRQEFADTMLEIGKKDSRLTVFVGDISHYILQPFAKACPGRYYNIGICEQAMVNMAAGLSKVGLIPVVHTIAPFLIERAFEQIKVDFGYQKLGINLISVGAGFDYGALGSTHHCYDDFALLKNIDNMQIIYPGSCLEFNALFKQTYDNGFPTYFRLPEEKHGVEFKEEGIKFGKGIRVRKGKDITLVAVGPQLKTAMESADSLEKMAIGAEIIYIHTIKPFDNQMIKRSLLKTGRGLVIEEHSQYGGVLEEVLRCSRDLENIKIDSINIGDSYLRTYGDYSSHCKRLGFSKENLILKTKKLLLRKK